MGCRMNVAVLVSAGLTLGVASWHPHTTQAALTGVVSDGPQSTDWSVYNGNVQGQHHSPITQITPTNVRQLKQVWRTDVGSDGGLQANPLMIGRTLFTYGPTLQVIALDGATGKQLWVFDPQVVSRQPSRGFTYWTDGKQTRLFAYILNFLYALDPATGKPIASFGEGGRLDMRKDLGPDFAQNSVVLTTPGTLYKDDLILGFRAPETNPAPHGDIRSYNVLTGKLNWTFHTIPHPGEAGYKTWPEGAWKTAGAANNWAGSVLDEARGIVYVPTGSAVSDFYGFDRVGDDLYANTLLALDARSGKLLWHFQAVHHDIWDRDFPSPPVLLTVQHDGKSVDAIAQTTKQGIVFLFDRVTGKSLFPIEEHPFPASDVPGEVTSKTQPIPLAPAPFARQRLVADMLTARTPNAHAWALEQFKTMRSGGQFLPFAVGKQTITFPGFDGGAEWGGPAVDPKSGVIYINANDLPWTGGLVETQSGSAGQLLYQTQCAVCHGRDKSGNPPAFPSLVGVVQQLSPTQIADIVHGGKGRMPGFPTVEGERLTQLLDYLQSGTDASTSGRSSDKTELASATTSSSNPKFRFTGYRKFLDPEGYPAVVPPWGTLNAIDLNTGKYLWKIPLGNYPALVEKGMADTGSENYGGPILTASGLLFISATVYDRKIRAFDSHTGKLLWEAGLPFAGNATPSTYMIDGKQYLVIACSSARDPKSPQGSAYVAFALP